MKKTLMITLGSVALASALFAGCGCGDKGHCGPDSKQERKGYCENKEGEMMFKDLELSKEQKKSLRELKIAHHEEMGDMKALKKDLMMDSIDESGFNKALFIENADKLHAKMGQEQANFFEKAYNLLTDEQKAKLKAMKQ